MVRSKSNDDDFLRWQINLFGPARVFLKIETRSCLVTTLNVGAGEGETERPPGRCWSPGGTAEPGGWRGTPSSVRSPEPRCEERRSCASLLAEIRHRCGVVAKDSHRATL